MPIRTVSTAAVGQETDTDAEVVVSLKPVMPSSRGVAGALAAAGDVPD